jgi:hypothetical protein
LWAGLCQVDSAKKGAPKFYFFCPVSLLYSLNKKQFSAMPNLIHVAVSQLEKMPCLTLKTSTAKDLRVGRQPEKTLHTPTHPPMQAGTPAQAHTRTGREAMVVTDHLNPQKITDFITVIRSLHPHYKIAFAPHTYLTTQFSNCSKANTDLFFNLVQTFTLLNHLHRQTSVENVLTTADEDYTQAYQLWQHCQPKKTTPQYLPTVKLVLQLLQYRYHTKPFTILQIAAQLNYTTQYIGKIFEQLQQQKRIQPLNTTNRQQSFELCH